MVGRIFALLLLLIILFVSYSWLSAGGWNQIKANAAHYANPLGEFWEDQKGRPVEYSIEAFTPATPTYGGSTIGNTAAQAEAVRQFGDPSPSRGLVTIEPSNVYVVGEKTVASEFVTIRATSDNTSPVSLTGWSLASAVSGVRRYIPQGTPLYVLGSVSSTETISLSPGQTAIINSGSSPLGVSFKENSCSGYLSQFQSFTPSIGGSCPSPSNEMPNTLENLQTFGAECIDFVRSLSRCKYYLGEFPPAVSLNCRVFVSNALSYNGCLQRHQYDANFTTGAWRIYLGSDDILWHPLHDVVRLLDAQGRTVDVWSY